MQNINLKINKGEKIGIIGKSGAGKTTIIKLIIRLYNPDSGEILLNRINLKEYNTIDLLKAINILFQDFAVYAFSIRDNITLGRDVSDEDIFSSLDKLSLREKIETVGLDTAITSQLNEKSVELSGGETQRIAIARVYNNDSSFLILDEPTSNLDMLSEYNLFKDVLASDSRFETSVIISHRLTLTYKMDKIFVLNNGIIQEEGSHTELLQKDGIYADMYKMQTEKYVDTVR